MQKVTIFDKNRVFFGKIGKAGFPLVKTQKLLGNRHFSSFYNKHILKRDYVKVVSFSGLGCTEGVVKPSPHPLTFLLLSLSLFLYTFSIHISSPIIIVIIIVIIFGLKSLYSIMVFYGFFKS